MRTIILSCLLTFSPARAWACLGEEFEAYVFVAAKPDLVPAGLQVLRVQAVKPEEVLKSPESAIVQVLERNAYLEQGQLLRIEADMGSDCARWGAVQAPAFIVGRLWRGRDGTPYLRAIPLKMRWAGRKTRGRSVEELDSYIVDSTWRELAKRARSK